MVNALDLIADKYRDCDDSTPATDAPTPSPELAELGELLRRNSIGLRRTLKGLRLIYHDRAAVNLADQVEIIALLHVCWPEIRAHHWQRIEPDADAPVTGPFQPLDDTGATSRELFARGNYGNVCTLHTDGDSSRENIGNPNG